MLHEVPMPGDAVRIDGYYVCTQRGDIAILGGTLGVAYDEYSACFSASAHRDKGFVSCSGGPVPYIGADQLRPTGETIRVRFWRWKNGHVAAHNGEDYYLEVPLWSWVPDGHIARTEAAMRTLAFWHEDGFVPRSIPEEMHARMTLGLPIAPMLEPSEEFDRAKGWFDQSIRETLSPEAMAERAIHRLAFRWQWSAKRVLAWLKAGRVEIPKNLTI